MKINVKRLLCLGLCLALAASTAACTKGTTHDPVAAVNGQPAVFVTTPNSLMKFVQDNQNIKVYSVDKLDRESGVVVDVDASVTYQTVEGWGCAMTETSAINLAKMPQEMQTQVMTDLFSENEGIGLNIIRLPLGISDFSLDPNRSYDSVEGDVELENFSIAYDEEVIIPYIKQAMEIANCPDDFMVFAASWTAPLWMKTIPEFHSKNSSTLKREYYDVFARYLVKALQAYKDNGIDIDYITAQNEPSGVHGIAAMYMTSDNMATLINMYLKPELDKSGLDTKIMCWDFNYTDGSTLTLGKTYGNVGGLAYHVYGGDFQVLVDTHNAFPDIPLYITEAAGKVSSNSAIFFRQMKNMTQTMRAGSSAHILWNIVLDENMGPALIDEDGNSVNTIGIGLMEYNTQTQEVAYLMDFYALAHFSKFVRPGAVRVESTDTGADTNDNVVNVVYRNENGSMVAVLTNNTGMENTFKLVIGDQVIEYTVPALSGATITWDPKIEG